MDHLLEPDGFNSNLGIITTKDGLEGLLLDAWPVPTVEYTPNLRIVITLTYY
jgi:hypothetical protein